MDPKLALMAFVLVISVLAIIYAAFQQWLQHKEKMSLLMAEQTAERAAQYGAHVERVGSRRASSTEASNQRQDKPGQLDTGAHYRSCH